MREIKFRARRKLNGDWVYGCLIINGRAEDWDYIMPIHADNSETDYWQSSGVTRVISETVGQFTGLCDKNGKEIYEGDIIQSWAAHNIIAEIFYWPEMMSFAYRDATNVDNKMLWTILSRSGVDYDIAVIGNIHKNPELLKK